ncbi:MAG: hypothetical protein A2Z20_07070 [Bdellovibrionales bacterium RBG_16_40_8]|nr:MAG: hypothetical protein A2Z20_07070 [Bdellovibrionales bacterium RBG_16_40_8]
MKKSPRALGFTLIEVIIAVTILAFITLFTGRMIQQGVKARVKIQGELDRTSRLSAALRLMDQDIALAFHYHNINIELYNAAQQQRKKNKEATKSSENPDEFKLKEEKTYTRFIGEADNINFTSLNNFRSVRNLQQSDQIEVGYYLENCSRNVKNKNTTSQCLWRRVSPFIDDNINEGGKSSAILENVKNLKFRYLGPGHENEWIETWNSETGEEVMKNKFPDAVEITLVTLDTKFSPPKETAMTVVAAIRFPNNKPETSGESTNAVH